MSNNYRKNTKTKTNKQANEHMFYYKTNINSNRYVN